MIKRQKNNLLPLLKEHMMNIISFLSDKNFATITTIIPLAITLLTTIAQVYSIATQTKISYTLKTHEEQTKIKLYNDYTIFVLLLLLMLSLSIGIKMIIQFQSPSKSLNAESEISFSTETSDITITSTENEDLANSINNDSNHETESIPNNEDILSKILSYIIFLSLLVISIPISYLITFLYRKKDEKHWFKKLPFGNKIEIIILLPLCTWALLDSLLLLVLYSLFYKLDILFVIFLSFVITLFLITGCGFISQREKLPAKMKTIWNNDIYYIFAKEGTTLLAGKVKNQYDCKQFYLLDIKELKEPLVELSADLTIPEKKDTEEEKLIKEISGIKNEIQQTRIIIQKEKSRKSENIFQYIKNYFMNIF